MGDKKEIQRLLKITRSRKRQGRRFRVELLNGHYKVTAPNGEWRWLPGTPNDVRSVQAAKGKLRALGVKLP